MKKVALELGLTKSTKAYRRFIILGRSRAGSNYLRGLLNSHNGIIAFGELFGGHQEINWDVAGHIQSQKTHQLHQTDPVRFLEREVFRRYPEHVLAVGFKLFYYHAQDNPWAAIWPYLHSQQNVAVIHLKRRNILKTYLSWMRASLSGQWVNTSGRGTKVTPVPLSFESCLDFFTQTSKWENEFDDWFSEHPMINVVYEDLAADTEKEMNRIQTFLGVDVQKLSPSTYKQSRYPTSQLIANYEELKERFAGTQWERFFDD